MNTLKVHIQNAAEAVKVPPARFAACLAAMLLLVATFSLAFPPQAHAVLFDGVVENLNNWIAELVRGVAEWLLGTGVSVMQNINLSTVLTAPFENMLGDSGNATTVYTYANKLCQVGVKPIAASILSLVMLLELVKISQRMDANATLPAVKEVLFLAVFCTFFIFLIRYSQDICIIIYNLVSQITAQITDPSSVTNASISISSDVTDIGVLAVLILVGLLVMVIAFAAYVIALLMGYARAIQLYVLMAFAPIPFALLGFDETRSMGVNYIKVFASVCLAGTIMVFLMVCFPLLINGVMSDMAAAGNTALAQSTPADLATYLLSPLQLVAVALLLCFGLIKSGSWARDVFGG